MAAYIPKRRARGEWIARIDLDDLARRVIHAIIVIGWFGFVGLMLIDVLRGAP